MRAFKAVALTCVCVALASCGTSGIQNAQLATSAVPKTSARFKITRTNDLLYISEAASVRVSGKKVTDIAAGETAYIDVPAGRQVIVGVYSENHIGFHIVRLHAEPGARYAFEISPRVANFIADSGVGIAGDIMDATINQDSGAFAIRFVGKS